MSLAACSTCGGEVVDSLSREMQMIKAAGGVMEVDISSATGRRILKGLCWVCNRLRGSASKEGLTDGPDS